MKEINIYDIDEGTGNVHKLKIKIPKLQSDNKLNELLTLDESLHTAEETLMLYTETYAIGNEPTEIFDQGNVLTEFKKKIKECFGENCEIEKRNGKNRYGWYRYFRFIFGNGNVFDLVPYRWTIKKENRKYIKINNMLWVQGKIKFEHGCEEKNNFTSFWQWQVPKSFPTAKFEPKEREILVPKNSEDFFPKLDGSDLMIAENFGSDIVGALLHWKPSLEAYIK